MTFTLSIDCDNAAFDGHANQETARILRALASRLCAAPLEDEGRLRDVNGNTVGTFGFREGA